jgi:protein O-GlcNAc transferase
MSEVMAKNKKSNLPEDLLKELQAVNSLQQAGQYNQALLSCNQLLLVYPEHPVVVHYLGVLHLNINQPRITIEYLERAIKHSPKQAVSYNFLGIAYCQLKELDKGITFYKRALKLQPKYAEAYYNLGIANIQLKNFAVGEKCLHKALALNFEIPEIFYNIGYLFHERREFKEAIKFYQKALKLSPNAIRVACNLGEVLIETNQFKDALTVYKNVVALRTDSYVFQKLGLLYYLLKEYDQAINSLEKIKQLSEEDYYLLASSYWGLKEYHNSIRVYMEALREYPHNLTFLLFLIQHNRFLCLWKDEIELLNRLKSRLHDENYLFKYAQYYILGFSFPEELQFAKKVAAYFQHKIDKVVNVPRFKHSRKMNKKLKIGYLSSNVRNHANAYTINTLFPAHDTKNFDIYLYSVRKPDSSVIAKEIISVVPNFVDLSEEDFLGAAKKIYKDDIDILVDFTGYHHDVAVYITALKPAKTQIGFMGHCGTRGANFIDYIFTDKTVVSVDESQFFYEKLIYLPNTFFIASKKVDVTQTSREELNLPSDTFIFTCVNHPQKFEAKCFDAWMKILANIPNAILCLWLSEFEKVSKYTLLENAKAYGLENRLYFTGDLSKANHLGRLKVMDLFLDSFDCTAHSTAIDALLVGLPVVTLYGHNVASRGASSILKAHGMSDLVAYSIEEYIEKASYLAANPQILAKIRERIINNQKTEPLFDSTRLARNLESAYLSVKAQYEKNIKEHIFI